MREVIMLMSLLSFGLRLSCIGQNIDGKYVWSDPAGLVSSVIEFSENKFVQTNYSDVDSIFGSGYYLIDKNEVILFYDKHIKKDSSFFEIVETKNLGESELSLISIKIVDKDENEQNPNSGFMVYFDRGLKAILSMQPKPDNHIEFQVIDFQSVNFIRVMNFGYLPATISTEQFKGKSVILNCIMRLQKQSFIKEGRIKYTINKLDRDTILFSHGDQRIIFRKIK